MADQLTTTQVAWLRAEIGTTLTDPQLQERYNRLESVRDVALEALRERRTELLASPLSVSVDGVASVNNSENVKAIERRIAALVRLDDDPSDDPPVADGAGAVPLPFERLQLRRSRGR